MAESAVVKASTG